MRNAAECGKKNLVCRELAAESAAGALGNTIYANCPTVMRVKREVLSGMERFSFFIFLGKSSAIAKLTVQTK